MTIEYQVLNPDLVTLGWSSDPNDCDDNHPATSPTPGNDLGTPDPTNRLTLQRITLKYTHPESTNVDPDLQFIKGDN
jgi:hypothetical protein